MDGDYGRGLRLSGTGRHLYSYLTSFVLPAAQAALVFVQVSPAAFVHEEREPALDVSWQRWHFFSMSFEIITNSIIPETIMPFIRR